MFCPYKPATNSFLKASIKDQVSYVLLKSTAPAQKKKKNYANIHVYNLSGKKSIKNLNVSNVHVSQGSFCVLPEGFPPHEHTHPPAERDPFYRFKDSSLQEKKGRCQDTRCGPIQDHS